MKNQWKMLNNLTIRINTFYWNEMSGNLTSFIDSPSQLFSLSEVFENNVITGFITYVTYVNLTSLTDETHEMHNGSWTFEHTEWCYHLSYSTGTWWNCKIAFITVIHVDSSTYHPDLRVHMIIDVDLTDADKGFPWILCVRYKLSAIWNWLWDRE